MRISDWSSDVCSSDLLFLSTLVYGPLKDPLGFNFPQSRMFGDAALLPILLDGTRMHLGTLVALAVAVAGWVLMSFTIIGFQLRVLGQAPAAARFAGFSAARMVWFCLDRKSTRLNHSH